MSTLFTGCEHNGHYNIINYCDRPYKTVQEMNNDIKKKHNEKVKNGDVVYHLGDYCFHSENNRGNGESLTADDYLSQLYGEHIHVLGNHDVGNRNTLKTKNVEIILQIKKLRIQLIHDPTYARVDYPLILHSHVHNQWKVKELRYYRKTSLMINVGVDVNDFSPISLQEIFTIYYHWAKIRSRLKADRKNVQRELYEFFKYENKGTFNG